MAKTVKIDCGPISNTHLSHLNASEKYIPSALIQTNKVFYIKADFSKKKNLRNT